MINPANPVGAFLQGNQAGQQYRAGQQTMGLRQQQGDMQRQQFEAQQAEQQRAAEEAGRAEIAQALQWADTPEKWDQAVQFFEQNGIPQAAQYRGRFDLREMLAQQAGVNLPAQLQVRDRLIQDAGSDDPTVSESARVALGIQARPSSAGARLVSMTGADGRQRNYLQYADGSLVPASENIAGGAGGEAVDVSRPEEVQAGLTERSKVTARSEAEREATAPQRAERARQQVAAIDNTFAAIDRAAGDVGWSTAGPVGALMQGIPGTSARDLQQTIQTIRANIGFDRLQAMRDASPTGGALGQVAVQELNALQASIASLDQSQSPEQLRENLAAVRRHYENWKQAVMQSVEGEQQADDGWRIEAID